MDGILARIADEPDVIQSFTLEEVEEATAALLEVADAAEGDALEDVAAVSEMLAARRDALAAEADAKAEKLASIRKSLGVEDTTPDDSPDDDADDAPQADAETVDVPEEQTRSLLDALVAEGAAAYRDGRLSGYLLTPTGRAEHARRLSEELEVHGVRHAIHVIQRNRNIIVADCHLFNNRGVGVFLDGVNLHQINIHGRARSPMPTNIANTIST